MIFSLLKVRKKTSAFIAGIAIALGCLWGVSMWQDISRKEMLSILLGSLLMLGSIMLAAVLLTLLIVLLRKLLAIIADLFSPKD